MIDSFIPVLDLAERNRVEWHCLFETRVRWSGRVPWHGSGRESASSLNSDATVRWT